MKLRIQTRTFGDGPFPPGPDDEDGEDEKSCYPGPYDDDPPEEPVHFE